MLIPRHVFSPRSGPHRTPVPFSLPILVFRYADYHTPPVPSPVSVCLHLNLHLQHLPIFCFVMVRFLDIACLTKARALKSRITPLTWALLARSVPFRLAFSSSSCSSPSSGSVATVMGGAGVESAAETADKIAAPSAAAAVPSSLRHEVCHRLLMERFLSDTSYAGTEASPEGLGRALEALRVLLDDEDCLLEVKGLHG